MDDRNGISPSHSTGLYRMDRQKNQSRNRREMMKKFLFFAVWFLIMGIISTVTYTALTTPNKPIPVTITNNPTEAQFKALEVRVTALEDWAVRHGGKMR